MDSIKQSSQPLIHEKFPSEIMADIFQSFVDDVCQSCSFTKWRGLDLITNTDYNNISPALCLGAVCHTWRQIAWTSPKLWKSINIAPRASDDWLCADIAVECLKRAGQLPLEIAIQLRALNSYVYDPTDILYLGVLTFRIASVLNTLSGQWEFIQVTGSPGLFSIPWTGSKSNCYIGKLLMNFSSVAVGSHKPTSESSTIARERRPRPSGVHITGLPYSALGMDWINLTHFQFYGDFWLGECVHLLRHAPQLEICILQSIEDPDLSHGTYHITSFTHHSLRKLFIELYFGRDGLRLFLEALTLPNLRHLVFEEVEEADPKLIGDAVAAMVDRSSCHLITLKLPSTF